MNTAVTSKDAIMQKCRKIVSEKGLSALNMRAVADECHIALGTLYNYYSGKNELVIATVESVWKDIFHMNDECYTDLSFTDYVKYIFDCVQMGAKKYPNFFNAHSLGIANAEKGKAKSAMEHYFNHMKAGMVEVMRADNSVKENAFSSDFTEYDFADFVLGNILVLLAQNKNNCETLVTIIRKVIY